MGVLALAATSDASDEPHCLDSGSGAEKTLDTDPETTSHRLGQYELFGAAVVELDGHKQKRGVRIADEFFDGVTINAGLLFATEPVLPARCSPTRSWRS